MNRKQQCWLALATAAALSMPAVAQDYRANDYRYQSAEDPARQNVPPPQYIQQQGQQQRAPAALCASCGTVDAVRTVEKAGEGSPVGMLAGGLLGGLIGHQIGQGRGNTAATIVGAAGGAYAGHQIEKNVRKVVRYEVSVRMDDGSMRNVSYDVEPGFRSGDQVRFIDGRLTRF